MKKVQLKIDLDFKNTYCDFPITVYVKRALLRHMANTEADTK